MVPQADGSGQKVRDEGFFGASGTPKQNLGISVEILTEEWIDA
jgi:hypothetical protein